MVLFKIIEVIKMEKAIKITGAIFDLDGTLLNSMDYWCSAASIFLKNNGIEPYAEAGRDFLENGMAWCHEKWTAELGLRLDFEATKSQIYKIMEEHYRTDVAVKAGAREMLEDLRAHGVKMCLATATDRYIVEDTLCRLGIAEFFDKIFTCTEVGKGKRYPLIYERALEYLGTDKETTYVFEDAYFALVTAHANGFHTIGIYDKNVFVPEKELIPLCDAYLTSYGLRLEK